MKQYPSLIPYLIKRYTEIDPITGEKKCSYTKEYHLYDVEKKRILMQNIPLEYISYIDYSFEESIALVIEKRDNGITSYSIIETSHDLGENGEGFQGQSYALQTIDGLESNLGNVFLPISFGKIIK